MPVSLLALFGIGMGVGGFSMGLDPVRRRLGYSLNYQVPNRDYEIADAFELRRRGIITEPEYTLILRKQGINNERAKKLWTGSQRLRDADDLLVLKWRGEITEETYINGMNELGFPQDVAVDYEKRNLYYPGAGDIIRQAVREAYTPEIVDRFRLDEDLPPVYLERAAKAGIPEEEARFAWRVKWILPSLTLGYEMLHRRIIDRDDLMLLMRTQDVMPFWRDKLIELSYVPYTRVDVRRMHAFGILNKDQVYWSYRDLGYDHEKATNMTEFTVAFNMPNERDLTRAMILDAYEQEEIPREVAVGYIQGMGYDPGEAELIVILRENEIGEKELKDKIASITTRYRKGVLTEDEATDALDALDLKGAYRDRVIAGVQAAKREDQKLPTKDDLKDMWKNKIITREVWRDFMLRLGYPESIVDLYDQLYSKTLRVG